MAAVPTGLLVICDIWQLFEVEEEIKDDLKDH